MYNLKETLNILPVDCQLYLETLNVFLISCLYKIAFIQKLSKISSDSILSEVDTVPRDYKPPSEILKPTLDYIAKLRNISVDDLMDTIRTNSIRLMGGVPQLENYTALLR